MIENELSDPKAGANLLDVVAIDGPAAAGKSTVARGVAKHLGLPFFDTGLLYRAVTLLALQRNVPLYDEEQLAYIARSMGIELAGDGNLILQGIDESRGLRTPEVDAAVSQVAAHPQVREALFQRQRSVAESSPVVMVGRDITSVVAPDAKVRVYLDASLEERARRRHAEIVGSDPGISFEEVLNDLRERDRKDSEREAAPLRAAPGVQVIDTDMLSLEQVIEAVSELSVVKLKQDSPSTGPVDNIPQQYIEGTGHSFRRRFAQRTNGWWIRLISDLNVVGVENVPAWGPLLVVSNHLHNLDPVIEYYSFPRPLHFMGKKELFKYPIVRQIAELSGGFPVDRGKVDREAIRQAEDRISRGIPLGMYPEGGRSPTGALVEAKAGAGLLALKSGAPILPMAISGSERLPLNGSKGQMQSKGLRPEPDHSGVRIVYGQPFTINREQHGRKIRWDEATEILMLEIARLLPRDYRGVYTELLELEPVRRITPYSSG